MYFRVQQQAQALQVDDNYAHLAAVAADGSLQFEFTYSVSQSQVVQRGASRVDVAVESRSIVKKPLLGQTQRGRVDTRALVDNLRTYVIDAKSAAEQQTKYVVCSTSSDITAAVNNEIIPQLVGRVPISQIPTLTQSRLAVVNAASIRQGNDPQPLLHRVANSLTVPDLQQAMTSSAGAQPQALMHDMIARLGLDPTYALGLTPRTSSAMATRGGLSNTQKAVEAVTDPATQLLNYLIFPPAFDNIPTTTDDVTDSDLVQVIQPVTSDMVEVIAQVTVPAQALQQVGAATTQLYVVFNLIDGQTNLPIDTVTKVLDVPQHVRLFNTPKAPPQVGFAPSGLQGRINLEIKQVDPGATGVYVYKKSFWVASPETDEYTLVGSYPLSARDQSLLIQLDLPQASPVLYRVVSVGLQSIMGFEFTNVAVRPARYSPVRSVSLTALQVDTGAQLEVRHIPTNVVAVQFLRWNMTTHQAAASPTTVGTDVGFVDDSVRQADLLTTIDSTVAPGNIYRYVARLIYVDGMTKDYGDATVDFLQPAPGQVDTRISDLVVSHDDVPNVTFSIATSTIDSDIDVAVQMLAKQGLTDYFKGDIAAQRDQLQNLIAHNVQRVDLTSGQREDFGILTSGQFDDASLRSRQAVAVLRYGHRYRYEVYPLLRAPETLFDSFVKTSTDVVTKKPYTYSPAKFLHPFTLSRGVIVSTSGARLRHAKDPMSYGVIGSVVSTEVSLDGDSAKVVDQAAAAFDRYTNVLTWNVLGDVSQVDHFVIMRQVHGMRTVLGKAHSAFANGSCQYVHALSAQDAGALQYVIVPIYGDYKVGPEAITNTLIVEAP